MNQRLLSLGTYFIFFLLGMGTILPIFDRREYVFSSEYVGVARADPIPTGDDEAFWNDTSISPTINPRVAWNYIKSHIQYTLSVRNSSKVVRDITHDLSINVDSRGSNHKITYNIYLPYKGYYWLNFSIDNPGVSLKLNRTTNTLTATYEKDGHNFDFIYNYSDLLGKDLSFMWNVNSSILEFGVSRDITTGTFPRKIVWDPIATVQASGLSVSTLWGGQRKISRTSNGRLVCVYMYAINQINLAISSTNGSTWTTYVASPVYTIGARNQTNVSAAIDSNNVIHYVWSGQIGSRTGNGEKSYVLRYRRYFVQNNTFVASIQNISMPTKPFLPSQKLPSIAIDGNNKIHIVWMGNSTGFGSGVRIRHCTITAGVISSIQNFSAIANSSVACNAPSVMIDAENNLCLGWAGYDSGLSTLNIRYRKWYSSNSTWNTKMINVTSTAAANPQGFPCIVVNATNYIHLVWQGEVPSSTNYCIRYSSSLDGRTFTIPITLTNESASGGLIQSYPSMSYNGSSLHASWVGRFLLSSGSLSYQKLRMINYSNGVWQPATNITIGNAVHCYGASLMCANWPIVLHNQTNVPRQGYCGIFVNSTTITYFNTTNGKANLIWSSRINVLESYPTNMTTNIQREPFHLKIKVNSPQGAKMNITWYTSSGRDISPDNIVQTNSSVTNGTYMYMIPSTLNWSEHYYWKVYVEDGHALGGWNSTYWFVTRGSGRDVIIYGNETWGYDFQNVTQRVKTTATTYVNTPVSGRQMVRSSTGRLFTVYDTVRGRPANQTQINLAYSLNNGTTWIQRFITENRTGGKYYQIQPSCAIDSNDVIHIAWAGQQPEFSASSGVMVLRYRKFYVSNLSYSIKTQNFSLFRPFGVNFTNVCIDKKDNVHILWAQQDARFSYTTIKHIFYNATNNSWGSAISGVPRYYNFSVCGGAANHLNPDATVDTNNVLHITWYGYTVNHAGNNILYRRFFGSNRTWSTKILNITAQPVANPQTYPSIVVDGDNLVHIAWMGETNVSTTYANIRYTNLTYYKRILNVSAYIPAAGMGISYYPSLSVNQTRGLRIVFSSSYVGNNLNILRLRVINRTAHGVWGRPVNLTAAGLQCYQPVSLYANYPKINGVSTNIPSTGVACTFFVQYADGLLHYYNTSNLKWQNNPPVIAGHHPTNSSTGIAFDPIDGVRTYINITDADTDPMDIVWSTNVTGKWLNNAPNNVSVLNGTYYHSFTAFNAANTKYFWRVNITDLYYHYENSSNATATYLFWTVAGGVNDPPTITSVGVYKNQTLGTPLRPTIFFWANDTDDANLVVNIYTNGSGIWLHSQKNFSNGMPGEILHYNYSTAFDGGKRYYYNISVFDGTTNISRFFWFQTRYPVFWAVTTGWNVSFRNSTVLWQSVKQHFNISFKNQTTQESLKQHWNISFKNTSGIANALDNFNISFRNTLSGSQANIRTYKADGINHLDGSNSSGFYGSGTYRGLNVTKPFGGTNYSDITYYDGTSINVTTRVAGEFASIRVPIYIGEPISNMSLVSIYIYAYGGSRDGGVAPGPTYHYGVYSVIKEDGDWALKGSHSAGSIQMMGETKGANFNQWFQNNMVYVGVQSRHSSDGVNYSFIYVDYIYVKVTMRVHPLNQSRIRLPPTNLSAYVWENKNNPMDVYVYTNTTGVWTLLNSSLGVHNGTKVFYNTGIFSVEKRHYWSVNISTGNHVWDNHTYWFESASWHGKGWNVSFKNTTTTEGLRQAFNVSFKNSSSTRVVKQNFNVSFKNRTASFNTIKQDFNVSFRNSSITDWHNVFHWDVNFKNSTLLRVYVDDNAPAAWYNESHVHTIQEGFTNVSTGGTVYVWDGTYTSKGIINKTISVVGNGSTSIIKLDHETIKAVSVNQVDYVNITGLNITGANTSIFVDRSDYCNVSCCILFANATDAIYTNYAEHGNYSYNDIRSNNSGIHLTGDSSWTLISHNNIHNVVNYGVIIINDCQNCTVSYNNMTNIYYGLYTRVSQGSNNTIMYNNMKNGCVGITVAASKYLSIYGNNISQMSSSGIGLLNTNYSRIMNNTVSGNLTAISLITASAYDIIYNNSFTGGGCVVIDEGLYNVWNTTKTLGRNIIHGPYVGGNYYSNNTGANVGDGFTVPYHISGMIIDYLPLGYPKTNKVSAWNISFKNGSVVQKRFDWNISFRNTSSARMENGWNVSFRNSTVAWRTIKNDFNISFKNGSTMRMVKRMGWNVSWRNSSLQNITLNNVYPANMSTGIALETILVINITQIKGQPMTVHWMWGLTEACTESLGYNYTLVNGTFVKRLWNATSLNTKYYWKVNVNDTDTWANGTYHFTTRTAGGGGGAGGAGNAMLNDQWWLLAVGLVAGIIIAPVIWSKRREDDEEDEYEEEE